MNTQQVTIYKKILRLQQGRRVFSQRLAREQCQYTRTLPAILRRRHTRLTKKGLLSRRMRVSIFHAHTQGVQGIERITQGLHSVLGA